MIDRLTVQRILDTAQIVDVVSDFVSLKRAGANYKGLCPFHDDRTPSFMVSPAKNYCKCFACGKGGSPVGFIMEHEQLTYPDALKYLARKYNIEVKEREQTDEERAAISERESMFALNQFVLDWFQKQLYETDEGRSIGMAYFRHRGFRDDIVRKFSLGFSPMRRDALYFDALARGFSRDVLLKTGLIFEPANGGTPIDRFHGRVIFPIFNMSGKVCGFGGRVLDAATKGVNVKYQNSPESAVYSKKRELYGLYQAKQAIVKCDSCYLVEGYTDVMAMHQMGVENVVASSGTALTAEQIALIHRLTANIVVVYDGDEAGIKASQRGIDLLLEAGMNVRLLLLPDGDDPDSFGRKHSAHEYQDYMLKHQVDFIGFKTNLLLQEAKDDPIKLSHLIGGIVESIARIPDPITCRTYVRHAAQMLQMDEQLIAASVKSAKQTQRPLAGDRQGMNAATAPRPSTAAQPGQPADPSPAQPWAQTGEQPQSTASGAGDNPVVAAQPLKPAIVAPPTDPLAGIEREIMRLVVTCGEMTMCNVVDENGKECALTVAEYIDGALGQDNLELKNPLYRDVLRMALEDLQPGAVAADVFFMNHPRPDVARLAFELSTDQEPLSRYHTKGQHIRTTEERLMEVVPTTMNTYKLAIVERDLRSLQLSLRSPEALADKAVATGILQRYAELKKVQGLLAKACGERVVTR